MPAGAHAGEPARARAADQTRQREPFASDPGPAHAFALAGAAAEREP